MTRAERIRMVTMNCCPACKQPLKKLPLTIDLNTNILLAGNTALRIPPKYAELIFLLKERAPAIVPEEMIIARIWGIEADVSRKLYHTTVCLARRYLEKVGYSIKNSAGVGYSLVQL